MKTVITPSTSDTKQIPKILRSIVSLFTCALLSIGTGLVCMEMFPSLPSVFIVSMISFVCSTVFVLLFSSRKKVTGSVTVFLIYLILFIILYKKIIDGAAVLYNDLSQSFTDLTRLRHGIYEITDESNSIFALSALLFPLSSLYAASAEKNDILPLLPVVAVLLAACFSGLLGGGMWIIIFTAALLLIRLSKGEKASDKNTARTFAVITLTLVITFGALILQSKIMTNTEDITTELSYVVHKNIYGCNDNSMPEGKLYDLGELKEDETPAVRIETEEPDDIYLRGFTGEYYNGKAWINSPEMIPSENSALFYWLHRENIYGNNIKGIAESFIENTETRKIKIGLLDSCKKYALVPVDMISSDIFDPDTIDDGSVINKASDYETEINVSSADPFTVQNQLASRTDDKKISNFLSYERAYSDFVNKYYLSLPDDTKETLAKIFTEDHSLYGIKEKTALVKKTINEYMFVNTSPVPFDGKGDFLTDLFCGKGGHSVHYATAEVLMLRYLGVPARYAEGYVLKKENAVTGENILTEKNALAWAEVYIDGAGWCVFDELPTDTDDKGGYSQDDNTPPSTLPEEQTEPEIPNEPERTPTDDQIYIRHSSLPWFILLLLPLIILLILIIRVRHILRKKLKAIDKADNNTSAALEYGYIKALLSEGAVLSEEDMNKAENINNEAVFSSHNINDEQRKLIKDIRYKAVGQLKKNSNIIRKINLKFIKGIY